jgi:phage-related protein
MALSMSFFSPFFLLECREQLQNNIASEKLSGYDGEMLTAQSCDARHIEITRFFNAARGRREMEGQLKRAFNTGCGGTLEYYHRVDRKRYSIGCTLEKAPEVIFNNARVEYVINLKCLDPYWYGTEVTQIIPPYTLTFQNIGDSAAGFTAELSGSASGPFISNGSGSTVAFIGSISGQTLKLTSMPDRVLAELGGANAMKNLSDATRRGFFLLDIGTNTVRYGASSGAGGLSVRLTYRPRYLGTF